MTAARLEHVNITVREPDATAAWLSEVFDWHIRWQGPAIHGGKSIHVGGDDWYVAVYNSGQPGKPADSSYGVYGGLNHIAVVVDDLEATEAKVKAAGFTPENHADYEPGRRFYFRDHDGIEFEVVAY
jgi:catechol 2,3-dioxygenase-like lactoylglutathione lyase family enzyme